YNLTVIDSSGQSPSFQAVRLASLKPQTAASSDRTGAQFDFKRNETQTHTKPNDWQTKTQTHTKPSVPDHPQKETDRGRRLLHDQRSQQQAISLLRRERVNGFSRTAQR